MFKKGGGPLKKKPILGSNKNLSNNTQAKTPNWLLEIPAKLDIELNDLYQRKVLDQRRWQSVVKSPDQDPLNRIIASVGSVWNYLCSQKGTGKQQASNFKALNEAFKSL